MLVITFMKLVHIVLKHNVQILEKQNQILQGDPNQNLKFRLAITLKVCISDPLLVKPKCVWEASIYFENCKQTAEKL